MRGFTCNARLIPYSCKPPMMVMIQGPPELTLILPFVLFPEHNINLAIFSNKMKTNTLSMCVDTR